MAGGLWILILTVLNFSISLAIIKQNDPVRNTSAPLIDENWSCSLRISRALHSMSHGRRSGKRVGQLELRGHVLYQPLKTVPFDMYVTDMQVRSPGLSWARVDRCRYDPEVNLLQARILFRDLIVTGTVQLVRGQRSSSPESCSMTLRMKRAGLGFTVSPKEKSNAETVTTFLEPQYVSVYAYGCRGIEEERKRHDLRPRIINDNSHTDEEEADEMRQEMEQVFLRGVRSLLAQYMEHKLHPALRDSLMVNLGYSLSYGR